MAFNYNPKQVEKQARVAKEWPRVVEQVFEVLGVSRDELAQLEHALVGRIVLPGMPDYPAARQGQGLQPYSPQPAIIVYCAVFGDVRLCLEWARAHDWWVTCRSGGHSTAGFSVNSGMVIDLSGLSYVVVDPVLKQARAGAGTLFQVLNATLDLYGLHVPGGECSSVAVGGYMQGGGYGFTSRIFGMNCDNVLAITVMLADGRLVTADQVRNADLFWAVRGGTGNNFGVLLEVTYRLEAVHDLYGFVLTWPVDRAAEALCLIQESYSKGDVATRLGHQDVFSTLAEGAVLAMVGMYDGSDAEGRACIDPLLKTGNPTLRMAKRDTYINLNSGLVQVFPGVPFQNVFEMKNGGYIAKPLAAADWQKIVDQYCRTPNPYNIAYMEVYGSAIGHPAPANAFIHRDVYMDFYIDSFWQPNTQFTDEKASRQWIDGFMDVLAPYVNGHKYQNYPVRDLPDYRWVYWGDAFPSLLWVKQKYDPTNFFCFEQSISPYPDAAGITRSQARPIFHDPEIVTTL
jgi:FAD/FMN-containing dehydrogenase